MALLVVNDWALVINISKISTVSMEVNLTSATFKTPTFSRTSAKDSISLVLATGSMPLLMISWIQSQALSRSSGADINRMMTGTNLSLAIRFMSIQEMNLPITSRQVHTSSASLASYCVWKTDGWMTCNFTSFSTVFQSYQDDGWVIMKGCVQWNPVYVWEDSAWSGIKLMTTRSVG